MERDTNSNDFDKPQEESIKESLGMFVSSWGAMALKESYDKRNTISIPSLGITIHKDRGVQPIEEIKTPPTDQSLKGIVGSSGFAVMALVESALKGNKIRVHGVSGEVYLTKEHLDPKIVAEYEAKQSAKEPEE